MTTHDELLLMPTNEMETIVIFAMHIEKFGFENIKYIKSEFPDLVAIRDGKEVRIEAEYDLRRFYRHYIADPQHHKNVHPRLYEFHENANWVDVSHSNLGYNIMNENFWSIRWTKKDDKTLRKYPQAYVIDKHKEMYTQSDGRYLYYKTLSRYCDCILYWTDSSKTEDTFSDDLELINMSKVFYDLGYIEKVDTTRLLKCGNKSKVKKWEWGIKNKAEK